MPPLNSEGNQMLSLSNSRLNFISLFACLSLILLLAHCTCSLRKSVHEFMS